MTVLLATGWAIALALAVAALRMRRRRELVADAEHELRGALTAFGLGVERLARTAAGRSLATALTSELARARAALAELSGGPDRAQPVPLERLVRSAAGAWAPAAPGGVIQVDWPGGAPLRPRAPGRVAQVLGNVVSNAVEHGEGPVAIRAVRAPGGVRVEVANGPRPASVKGSPQPGVVGSSRTGSAGRGRGLRIARRAARAAGGRLTIGAAPEGVTAALELPVER